MKCELQLIVVNLLALCLILHAQEINSQEETKVREPRILPSLFIDRVASFFSSNKQPDASSRDEISRSDFSGSQTESEGTEGQRSTGFSRSLFSPVQNLFKKASKSITSIVSKMKNNFVSRMSTPSDYVEASKKDYGFVSRNSLANIIAKDIAMNLEEEIAANKHKLKYDVRKISDTKFMKAENIPIKSNIKPQQFETALQEIEATRLIDDVSDGYDPFYSIKDADPEIVRHFDPEGDSTQFLIGEKKEETKLDPFAALYNLYSSWGEEPDEEVYDPRGWHIFS